MSPKYTIMLTNRKSFEPYAITVDCTKERVYWLENEIQSGVDHISSSEYDGSDQKTIISGSLNVHLLGVVGDLLYFLNNDLFYVNEMNVSNGNIYRNILVDSNSYYDLVVVHSSMQPQERMGEFNNHHHHRHSSLRSRRLADGQEKRKRLPKWLYDKFVFAH